MRKPQISLLKVSLAVASMLLVSTATFAHKGYKENYKGEVPCPVELVLKDGLYVGLQAGYDSYRNAYDTEEFLFDQEIDATTALPTPLFALSADPVFNSTGAVGGGFIGFGKYFDNFYGLYLALEIFGNWSGAQSDMEVFAAAPGLAAANPAGVGVLPLDVLQTSVEVNSNYGISVLPGIKLNNATLFYVRLGYNWANIETNESLGVNMAAAPSATTLAGTTISASQSNTIGGFNYGVGIESTFYDNWSVRAEYAHTDFNNLTSDFGSEFISADNQFMLGLIYHINM